MHIAIILDGNGRYATQQGQPRLFGHKAGVENLERIATACPDLRVDTLTVYAFAIANWKRDKEEVDGLWQLFRSMFQAELERLISSGVRVKVIGKRDDLDPDIQSMCADAEDRSKANTKLLLQIALNYDGVDEVARLIQRSLHENVDPATVTPAYILAHLDTEADNEPDIVIRTGMPAAQGKFAQWRSSAFLPLQSAQSVCVSTTTLWPAFTAGELQEIISFADPDSRLFGGQRT